MATTPNDFEVSPLNHPPRRRIAAKLGLSTAIATGAAILAAAPAHASEMGGEANLKLPDLGQVDIGGIGGRTLLACALIVCLLGLGFGVMTYGQLQKLPVHRSMREISELIYETCKEYLVKQVSSCWSCGRSSRR